jgi:hypothetical protein
MTIINLKTGKVRTTKKEPLPKCEICDTDVDKSGLSGKIGFLPVSFCYICTTGIVQMMMDKQDKEL